VRHEAATVLELSRVAELSVLPGETLTRLARELERHDERDGRQPGRLRDDEDGDHREAPGPVAGEEVAEAPAQARGQREQRAHGSM